MLKRPWFLGVLLLGACAPTASGPAAETISRVKNYYPFVVVGENQPRTFEVAISGNETAVLIGSKIAVDGGAVDSRLYALYRKGNYRVTVQEGGIVYMPTTKLIEVKGFYPEVREQPTEQFYKFCFLKDFGQKCTSNILAGGVTLYFNPLEESPVFQVYGDPGVRSFNEIHGNGFLVSTSISDFKTFLDQLPSANSN
ncbi:hypothetical protein [Deinococcus cellulosilyticus]|uniref:Lipoprotein n=1 Tax=Deinococcus cellulosilyticus (strain DSM 18568 / NBRC 106333 / KACC 11606 / 5516J-15) TaxID=1223518 RepID=A0A511MXP5_DEIC1|nr:hypothetical protein [Deinococcus cellulosilyticus]GEM45375.1 hypothetical protein DC3_10100 [Deinococcus cellulosilyticus NBRC 106333 = KACC 11606]